MRLPETTTTCLSDYFTDLTEQHDNLCDLNRLRDNCDSEYMDDTIDRVRSLSRVAVLLSVQAIMDNSPRDMWSGEEVDYIEMCRETALNSEDIE